MPITTAPNALESIHTDALLAVSGGCHKHCGGGSSSSSSSSSSGPIILQLPQMPAAQPAPAPAPQYAPPPDSGPQVSTSVSINGQPA
jgi:hypothetical protein